MKKTLIKKNNSVVKTYEGLTVNAKLPEQLFSFRPTDKLYKKNRWIIIILKNPQTTEKKQINSV